MKGLVKLLAKPKEPIADSSLVSNSRKVDDEFKNNLLYARLPYNQAGNRLRVFGS